MTGKVVSPDWYGDTMFQLSQLENIAVQLASLGRNLQTCGLGELGQNVINQARKVMATSENIHSVVSGHVCHSSDEYFKEMDKTLGIARSVLYASMNATKRKGK